ncbi:MAG: hypothetical protein GX227_10325 [Clostridiaceae bacterium]|jgi:hypothetical protein|nr:hypothetical protein [Clostridiaceae bacterium]
MRDRNTVAEIYRLAIIGAAIAILGDLIALLIACKEYCYALKQKSDDFVDVDSFLF